MIEILLSLVAFMLLAKKTPKRAFRAYIKGRIVQSLALTTLGALTLVSDIVDDTVDEKTWCSSVVLSWSMIGFTPVSADGPVLVGIAHSDYTDAEIQENIELNTNWSQGDQIAQEQGRRKVRIVGTFQNLASLDQAATLNDGKAIRTKCGWMLTTGQSIRYWAFNKGGSPLTTGSNLHVAGHANLWPR